MPAGRPPKYKTAKELQAKVDEYFEKGIEEVPVYDKNGDVSEIKKVATITGLVLFCGFVDRRSFYDLEKESKFSHTIKAARSRIEMHYEKLLQTGSPTGPIFALKNFGWSDKQEIEQTNSGEMKVTITRKLIK